MLQIRPSNITVAGVGLFTDATIKKGDIVAKYTGKILTDKQVSKLDSTHESARYLFCVRANRTIDGYADNRSLIRYINDATGPIRAKGLRNNCKFEIREDWPYVIATRNIKANEELFVPYGKDYWNELGAAIAEKLLMEQSAD